MTNEEINDFAISKIKKRQEKFVNEAMKSGFTKEQAEFLFNNYGNNSFMGIPMF